MRGIATEFIFMILTFFVLLVISFWLIYTYIYKTPVQNVFGLPDGTWYSLKGIDIKSFVHPPVLWFGDSLTIGGKKINYLKIYTQSEGDSVKLIFPRSIFVENVGPSPLHISSSEDTYLVGLIYSLMNPYKLHPGTYIFKFKTEELSTPYVAFYPLVTDNFGSLVDTEYNPAKLNTSLNLYYLGYPTKLNSTNFVLNFKIDLDKIGKYYENRDFYFDKTPESVKFSFYGESKTLRDYINEGICISEGTNKYSCSFGYSVFEKKCCPSYFELNNLTISFKLTKKDVEIWRREKLKKIKFTIVYYFDKISNIDLIFEKFDNIIAMLKNSGCKLGDINIYPCRAKIRTEKKGYLGAIKDADGSSIDWENCGSNSYKQLNKQDTTKKSTWYCKKKGEYLYLYNPYGYCEFNYNPIENKIEIPEVPKIVYLHSIIPSGKIDTELEVDFVLDTPFGIKNQAASILAAYAIYNFYNIFAGSESEKTLFSDISVDGRTIKFDFED